MFVNNALCAAVLYQALPALAIVHEKLGIIPSGWSRTTTFNQSATIGLTIALQHENLDQLEPKLLAISTPGSPEYGQHLDVDDVNALFAPSKQAIDAVESWLAKAGITNVAADGHGVTFSTTIEAANRLLNTTFMTVSKQGVSKLRTMEYSIPDDLVDFIDLITPTTYFGKTTAMVSKTRTKKVAPSERQVVDAPCQIKMTPSCLKEMYNVGTYQPDPTCGSRIGFGSFLNESTLYADLFQFESVFNISMQNISTTLINGADNDQSANTAKFVEANLDAQTIIGIGNPLPVDEFITGGSPPFIPNLDEPTADRNTNEPYLPYYTYLLSLPNSQLPQVISNSYGDDEQTVPLKYAIRVCNMIGMMGLRGISILESSGDTGVGGPCQSNDGKATPQFTPLFPGSCPYITAVGGTQAVTPEVAWTGSAGGFSNYFPRPGYQNLTVQTYLDLYISNETKTYYEPFANFQGRGFPDISAHSSGPDAEIIADGGSAAAGGTSLSAPVVAAIIGLLNDARLRAGKSSLGFLNPFLYSSGFNALNDITAGGSAGCAGINPQNGEDLEDGGLIEFASWNATVGWDPVTGLGTPDFQKLKDLVLSF